MPKIEIYTTAWCPYCRAARTLLEAKGAPYEEIEVSDADTRAAMIQRSHGRRTVPQIFVDGRHLGGYDDLAALERGGRLDAILNPSEGPLEEA